MDDREILQFLDELGDAGEAMDLAWKRFKKLSIKAIDVMKGELLSGMGTPLVAEAILEAMTTDRCESEYNGLRCNRAMGHKDVVSRQRAAVPWVKQAHLQSNDDHSEVTFWDDKGQSRTLPMHMSGPFGHIDMESVLRNSWPSLLEDEPA